MFLALIMVSQLQGRDNKCEAVHFGDGFKTWIGRGEDYGTSKEEGHYF